MASVKKSDTQKKAVRVRKSARKDESVPRIDYEKLVLANGLNVIFHVDRKLPVVHVNHWFHVGSKNERPGRTGFAHLFEHLMFQGSLNAKGSYFAYVEKAGANLREGGVNGTTSEDRTNYFVTVPSANLEHILWLESDRIATLADSLTQEGLDNQREVVRNERRQGVENQPYGRAGKLLTENLFPTGHPYSWPVIGSHEDLIAASMDDVRQFFRTYYTPNNLSLCIAGDFDPAEARKLVEKYYGSMSPGPALDRPGISIPSLDSEKTVEVRDRVSQERVYMAWPAPYFFGRQEPELTLASLILTDGLSSRLARKLVYEEQFCSQVSSVNDSSEIAGTFVVSATARPRASLSKVEEIITKEILSLASKGPTSRELIRAKTKWEYDYVSGLERIGGFGGKADRLNAYNTYLGDPGRFEDDILRHRLVTQKGVANAVEEWISGSGRLLLRFHPEVSKRPVTVVPDRTSTPPLGTDKAFRVPEIKSARLENGLEIFVVERNDLPKVSVVFATMAGGVAEPAGKMGVAQLVAQTIDRGTTTKKALEIEEKLGDLGTAVEGYAGRESSFLSFDVLSKSLSPAFSIFADVVRHPTFPQNEFGRERQLLLDSLEQEKNNPAAVAARMRSKLAFGKDHPYGRSLRGSRASVLSVSRENLIQHHRTFWTPQTSAITFAGNITLERAVELTARHFESWKASTSRALKFDDPTPFEPGKIYLVDRQDAAQTVVSQILRGPARASNDYYYLKLADAVWGGGFMTRLNLNLRESKGYTYGAFSTLVLLSKAGYWYSAASVQTDKTKESVQEFIHELNNLAGSKPISGEELAEAKANRIRGFAQQFESLRRICSLVTELWTFGLPVTELQREQEEIVGANVNSVNSVAQKYAVPENSMLLLVGDLAKIESPLRESGLGDIVVLDDEGQLVR